jgi:hypothetical protein
MKAAIGIGDSHFRLHGSSQRRPSPLQSPRLILPDGQIKRASGKHQSKSSPFCKNILIFRNRKSVYIHCHPVPTRGALRGRHGRWMRDAMDVAATRVILARTNGADADGKVVWS